METFQALLAEHLGGSPPPRGAIARFSRKTDVRDSVISRWLDKERPRRPSPENLERIAPELEVPYDQLVRIVYAGGQPDAQPDQPPRTYYRQRLAQVAEALAAAADEIRALAALDRNGEMGHDPSVDYIYQNGHRLRLVPTGPTPLLIPFLGGHIQQCPA